MQTMYLKAHQLAQHAMLPSTATAVQCMCLSKTAGCHSQEIGSTHPLALLSKCFPASNHLSCKPATNTADFLTCKPGEPQTISVANLPPTQWTFSLANLANLKPSQLQTCHQHSGLSHLRTWRTWQCPYIKYQPQQHDAVPDLT
jgi:hypothetical protein